MQNEIERKFLVKNDDFKTLSSEKHYIKQGFLSTNKKRTVRIRVKDDKGFLTIKGKSNKSGTTRLEWEKEINLLEAKQLLKICKKPIISKIRYIVPFQNHVFEVDVFKKKNKGLVVAEIELTNEDQVFEKPDWLGKEVTGDKRYYNAVLQKNPFKKWKSKY
jgi:CYTH domain-containing protein